MQELLSLMEEKRQPSACKEKKKGQNIQRQVMIIHKEDCKN